MEHKHALIMADLRQRIASGELAVGAAPGGDGAGGELWRQSAHLAQGAGTACAGGDGGAPAGARHLCRAGPGSGGADAALRGRHHQPSAPRLLSGADHAAQQRGEAVVNVSSTVSPLPDGELAYARTLLPRAAALLCRVEDAARLHALAPHLRLVAVNLQGLSPLDPGCDVIAGDTRMAARLAVQHLVHLGHRRIAFLGPASLPGDGPLYPASLPRISGLSRLCRCAGRVWTGGGVRHRLELPSRRTGRPSAAARYANCCARSRPCPPRMSATPISAPRCCCRPAWKWA